MNMAEREWRRSQFQKRFLNTVTDIMQGPLEPAYCCEDDLQEMWELNILVYYLHP